MIEIALAGVSVALAALPALLFLRNLRAYRPAPPPDAEPAAVSVLIPARNEELAIAASVEAALASRGVNLEVVVLDDHSEDRTADIVREIALRDGRVRLVSGHRCRRAGAASSTLVMCCREKRGMRFSCSSTPTCAWLPMA